jgi:hypothetical protein
MRFPWPSSDVANGQSRSEPVRQCDHPGVIMEGIEACAKLRLSLHWLELCNCNSRSGGTLRRLMANGLSLQSLRGWAHPCLKSFESVRLFAVTRPSALEPVCPCSGSCDLLAELENSFLDPTTSKAAKMPRTGVHVKSPHG